MGFSYSLLSNIATAGLNLIHTMIPARDSEEFYLLSEEFLQFWSYWLKWIDEHLEEIRNGIPFNLEQDWSLMKSNGIDGFLFLFNPNYKQVNRTILFDGKLNLQKPSEDGYWLLKEIYPQERFLGLVGYNDTITFLLDGQSVTVYQLIFSQSVIDQPILIGISGKASLTNKNVLMIDGVYGEAGTQMNDRIVVLLSDDRSISNVFLNGIEKRFQKDLEFIILTDLLSFPGLYLPRSAEILNNTIFYKQPRPVWTLLKGLISLWVIMNMNKPPDETLKQGRNQSWLLVKFVEYHLSLDMLQLNPGQFQGLFLENIERILVEP